MIVCAVQPHVDTIKREIRAIVGQLKGWNTRCVLRLAFVAYTDYDNPAPHQLDFTTDIQAFETHLSSITAAGGGDCAEDVFSGLEAAGKLSWSAGGRVLMHVGDAPCHGKEFHEGVGDRYPGGDKHGRCAATLLRNLADDCQLTGYVFHHLNQSTYKMMNRFELLLGPPLLTNDRHVYHAKWYNAVARIHQACLYFPCPCPCLLYATLQCIILQYHAAVRKLILEQFGTWDST